MRALPTRSNASRAAGSRIARALRALTGRRPRPAEPEPEVEPEPEAEEAVAAPPTLTGDEAAARIDAARKRLRATIAAPDDDVPSA